MLSLSKYERTLQIVGSLSNSYSSTGFSILTLRQASFDRLKTVQGERIEKRASDTLPSTSSGRGRTGRVNGLERRRPGRRFQKNAVQA
ncbi:MAG: hypothetical protein LBD67_04935 [Candidatus Accumulibacter sp.]|nr:hypothetical protein [Accumulibacter sp.]